MEGGGGGQPQRKRPRTKGKKLGGCPYFVEERRRYCGKEAIEGGQGFCQDHQPSPSDPSSFRTRIPCPFGPQHTIFADRVERHLKKCPAKKQFDAMTSAPYYRKGINSGLYDLQKSIHPQQLQNENENQNQNQNHSHNQNQNQNQNPQQTENQNQTQTQMQISTSFPIPSSCPTTCADENCVPTSLNSPTLPPSLSLSLSSLQSSFVVEEDTLSSSLSLSPINSSLSQVPLQKILEIKSKVEDAHKRFCTFAPLPTRILSHPVCQPFLEKTTTCNYKHMIQQSSILGHLKENGLLSDEFVYIEFGAGKGNLAELVHLASNAKILLVDKQVFRYKAETRHKREQEAKGRTSEEISGFFHRLFIDIGDLDLAAVDYLKNNNKNNNNNKTDGNRVVALAKHICGAAADLALRCVTGTLPEGQLYGLAIALCCHHRCSWTAYINKDFMQEVRISAEDFAIMTRMSSWATCAMPGVANRTKQKNKKRQNK